LPHELQLAETVGATSVPHVVALPAPLVVFIVGALGGPQTSVRGRHALVCTPSIVLTGAQTRSLVHSSPLGQPVTQNESLSNCAQTPLAPQSSLVTHSVHAELGAVDEGVDVDVDAAGGARFVSYVEVVSLCVPPSCAPHAAMPAMNADPDATTNVSTAA
jgi:hypothetical protein